MRVLSCVAIVHNVHALRSETKYRLGRVERESRGREAISDEVDPEELDRDKGLGHADRRSKEDAANREKKSAGDKLIAQEVGGGNKMPRIRRNNSTHLTTSPMLDEMR